MSWEKDRLVMLDQRLLPGKIAYIECEDFREIAEAIADMAVRGAPAIGIAGAYGVVLALRQAMLSSCDPGETIGVLKDASQILSQARPTAVNLSWAVDRVARKALAALSRRDNPVKHAFEAALQEAEKIMEEDVRANHKMGKFGATLLSPGSRVLTHCNAGALATGGYGTALGMIRSGWREGKISRVYACETRPFLQGARLTAWELLSDAIDVTLLVDSAAGLLISRGGVDCVVVGADRIARNGDVANKIGTYTLGCLCHLHDIPLYVVAPTSTVDLEASSLLDITVEERPPSEVLSCAGEIIAPAGASAYNPAFDLTPGRLVAAIITEKGIIRPPYEEGLVQAVGEGGVR